MTPPTPVLYFDLGSPYAYLAVERSASVLGVRPELQPILLGAIFSLRGSSSWATSPERPAQIAEVDRRADLYGLPPIRWRDGWPLNGLAAMRAATWAKREGRGEPFARAVFRRLFVDGADTSDLTVLCAAAGSAGLDADELPDAIARPEIKEELKRSTQQAWDVGVRGVPTLLIEGEVFYGDDQLERAATRLREREGRLSRRAAGR